MRILIIGGAGFIGGHLLKKLLNDKKIFNIDIIDNFSRAKNDKFLKDLAKDKRVSVLKENITTINDDKFKKKNYEFIFQFGAILGVENVINNPEKVLIDNFLIMKKAIEIAKKQKKLKKFVFLSTSEVYAGRLENFKIRFPTPESSPLALTNILNSRTSYMLSKIYCEAMCIHSNLRYLILRPHNIYGPRMGFSHVIPELIKKVFMLKKNNPLKLGSFNHKRAFCYIDDAVNQIYSITKSKIINETFNIGNNQEEISIIKLCNKILELSYRKDIKIIKKNINNFSPVRRLPAMNKIFRYIKKFEFTKLEYGLIKTLNWYKNN
jgi:nucleoside-diphosphate-sugar epimerase